MSPLPRLSQVLQSVKIDAAHPRRGPVLTSDYLDKAAKSGVANTFIDALWNHPDNKHVVDAFMNNAPCRQWSQSDDKTLLPTYQEYAIQDYFYLIDYIKFKALRLTTIPTSDLDTLTTEAKSVGSDTSYVADWANTCTTQLSIDARRLKTTDRSVAELGYANYLQNNASVNDWFNLHIIMIACTYGWSKLAMQLNASPKIVKNNVFYETWIKPNLNPDDPTKPNSSAAKLSAFLDANAKAWASEQDTTTEWRALFRTGLRLELALFQSAWQSKQEAV